MAIKVSTFIAHPGGVEAPAEGYKAKTYARLVITRENSEQRWALTHERTGMALNSLLPYSSSFSVAEMIRMAKAIEALKYDRVWELLQALPFGKGFEALPGGHEPHEPMLRDWRDKAREAARAALYSVRR